MEEQKPKTKKTIHRFFNPSTGAKLNVWAVTEDEAVSIFGSLVSDVIQWTCRKRKATKSSDKTKHGSLVH